MEEQISVFSMLDEYETPFMPRSEMKKDVKAWVIEYAAITNSWRDDAPIQYILVRPRQVVFIKDSIQKPDGRWDTFGENKGGRFFGWYGGRGFKLIFTHCPSWADQVRYIKEECDAWHEGIEIRPW